MGRVKQQPTQPPDRPKSPDQASDSARAAITVHVDVAACIKWFLLGFALVLLCWSMSSEQAEAILREAVEAKVPLWPDAGPPYDSSSRGLPELSADNGAAKPPKAEGRL